MPTYPYYVFNIIKGQYGYDLNITPSGDGSDIEGGLPQDVMEAYGLLDDLTAFFRARNGVVSVRVHRYTQTDTELIQE